MKKHIRGLSLLLILLAPLALQPAIAQEHPWRFSIHIDPGFNWFYVDNARYKNSGVHFGFCAGAEVEYAIIEQVSLLSGLSYDLRYADVRYKTDECQLKMLYDEEPHDIPERTLVETQAQYLKLPVGIKMRAVQIGYFSITASVGVNGSLIVSQRAAAPSIGVEKAKSKDMFAPGYVGYFIRVGTEYSLGGRSAVEAGLGYYGTFTSVYRPGIGGLGYHNISFRLGFVF